MGVLVKSVSEAPTAVLPRKVKGCQPLGFRHESHIYARDDQQFLTAVK